MKDNKEIRILGNNKKEDWAYGVKPTSWEIDSDKQFMKELQRMYELYMEEPKWTWKEYLVLTITTIAILIIL